MRCMYIDIWTGAQPPLWSANGLHIPAVGGCKRGWGEGCLETGQYGLFQ